MSLRSPNATTDVHPAHRFRSAVHPGWLPTMNNKALLPRADSPNMTRAVWVTSGADGTEHVVTDEQMTAGHAAKSGVYTAGCGMRVLVAAMVTPALRRCTPCLALLRPGPARRRAKHCRAGPLFSRLTRLLSTRRRSIAESPDPEGDTAPARGPGGNHDAWHPVGRL